MRVDFCQFTDVYGEAVCVNPLQVTYVKGSSDDEQTATTIYFSDTHSVVVAAEASAVVDGLTIEAD